MKTTKGGARAIRLAAALAASGILVLTTRPLEAIVTSDGHGTHVTTPGEPAFGMNVDGVVQLQFDFDDDDVGFCTGALIGDQHVLTAAHCFFTTNAGSNFNSDQQVRFDLADASTAVDVNGVTIHPLWTGDIDASGHDIAVIELAAPAPLTAPRYELFSGANEIGQKFIKVGYGATGFGGTGADTRDQLKRAGLNQYDATADQFLALVGLPSRPGDQHALVYDFDNGLSANDVFGALGIPELGFGDDEIGVGVGDSGGPTFILESGTHRIAGVTSLSAFLPSSFFVDVDDMLNQSWGEVGVDMRVSSFIPFVDDAVAGAIDPVRQVELSDGQTHVVDMADNDLVRVLDGSNSRHTTLNIMEGGSLGHPFFGPTVHARGSSVVNISGGTIQGMDEERLAADFIIAHPAINAGDSAVINVSGGSIHGNVIASGDAIVEMSGGTVDGHVSPSGNTAFTLSGGTITAEDIAVPAAGTSTVNVNGGTIIGDEVGINATQLSFFFDDPVSTIVHVTDGSIRGGIDGLRVNSQVTVDIRGGSIQGGESGGFEEDGVEAAGQARVNVSGGTIQGSFGVSVLEDAALEITGGTITGVEDGLYVDNDATAAVHGGEINGGGFGVDAYGNASVVITNGQIRADTAVWADESATIDIRGGAIHGESVDLFVASPDALIRVFGTNFSERRGPLTTLTGSFSGQFGDGSAFNFTFDRTAGGTITLVPEPSTSLLTSHALLAFFCRRRRRQLETT